MLGICSSFICVYGFRRYLLIMIYFIILKLIIILITPDIDFWNPKDGELTFLLFLFLVSLVKDFK